MLRIIAILCLLCSPSWAQIEVTPGRYLASARCVTPQPTGGKIKYRWSASSKIDAQPSATGKLCYFAGPAGEYEVTCLVATSTADSLDLQEFTETIKIGDKPGPTPVSLRDLVTDAEAEILARYFRDWAANAPRITSAEQFWAVYDTDFPPSGVAANEKLETALRARLSDGLKDLASFGDTLRGISAEFGGVDPTPVPPEPPKPDVKATAVVYVYEQRQTVVPIGVTVALNSLNRERNIRANLFEQHEVDGTGEVPEQYKAALSAAQDTGLPVLVVLAGNRVLATVRNPKTVEEVLEAVP